MEIDSKFVTLLHRHLLTPKEVQDRLYLELETEKNSRESTRNLFMFSYLELFNILRMYHQSTSAQRMSVLRQMSLDIKACPNLNSLYGVRLDVQQLQKYLEYVDVDDRFEDELKFRI